MGLRDKHFENTVGKGEIAHNEQFLLFPQCFLPIWITLCYFHQIYYCRLQTHSVWKSLKLDVWEWVNLDQLPPISNNKRDSLTRQLLPLPPNNPVNSLPNDNFLDLSKLKAFTDDKFKVSEKLKFVLGKVENIVGKGENAGYQHFLLFPQCF